MNSKSETFPNGLANRSDSLGRYLMDHTYATGAMGFFMGFNDKIDFRHLRCTVNIEVDIVYSGFSGKTERKIYIGY